jgi:hypothetical protein
VHANLALANPSSRDYKMLDFGTIDNSQIKPVADLDGSIKVQRARVKEAELLYTKALTPETKGKKAGEVNLDKALSSLGNIAAKKQVDKYAGLLVKDGNKQKAKKVKENLLAAFTKGKVKPSVLKEIQDEISNI